MEKVLTYLVGWIKPPKAGSSEEEHYSWRVGVAVGITVTAGTLIAHLIWSVGGMTMLGLGFARAEEVALLKQELNASRVTQITSTILELDEKRCHTDNQDLKQLLNQQITDMRIEFQKRSGTNFPLELNCENR